MAMLVAAERGFVTRDEVAERILKIVRFLERADRFHGVWPHFLDGRHGQGGALFRQVRQRRRSRRDRLHDPGPARGAPVLRPRHGRGARNTRHHHAAVARGRMGLVPTDARQRCPLLALVAGPRVSHQSSAHRLERDDDRLPAGHRLADASGAGELYHTGWAGTVRAACPLSPELEPHDGRAITIRTATASTASSWTSGSATGRTCSLRSFPSSVSIRAASAIATPIISRTTARSR